MSLITPQFNLDDRNFQDIVDEARKRIPFYIKDWTDHNVSDPGITLIELFAWMTDIILYRLNRVPDLHYIKMMEMLGVRLQEPVAAQAPVTFWLSTPMETAVVIPKGTEVASTQTETEASIVFTTDEDFEVKVPELLAVLSRVTSKSGDEKVFTKKQNLTNLMVGFQGFPAFSSNPRVDDALYFGFANDLSWHVIGFDLDCEHAGAAGIDPEDPPLVWEASTGKIGRGEQRWETCDMDIDTTKGLNDPGRVRIHVPQMGKRRLKEKGKEHYWIRVRVVKEYGETQKIRQVLVGSWGGTIPTTHAQEIKEEYLGQSDGSAGQRFQLQVMPILHRRPGETLTVGVEGQEPQEWVEVADFADSDSRSKHFTLDSATGELRLGPAIRQPDGTVKLYGDIPPRGAKLKHRKYRHGGGQIGNVQAHILNTLKTAIPYVDRVGNREDARGGLDQETLEAAMIRMPALLRSRERAVTADDFEFLSGQALPRSIGRVKCIQPLPLKGGRVDPGRVFVFVVPRVSEPAGYLEAEQLEIDDEDVALLTSYLDERRLLTTRLDVREPNYHWVAARVQLSAMPGANQQEIEADALARLYLFLNPLTGGRDGDGWTFGRDLFVSDISQSLQGIPNVQFIREIEMFNASSEGVMAGDPVTQIEVQDHGVIASGLHEIVIV